MLWMGSLRKKKLCHHKHLEYSWTDTLKSVPLCDMIGWLSPEDERKRKQIEKGKMRLRGYLERSSHDHKSFLLPYVGIDNVLIMVVRSGSRYNTVGVMWCRMNDCQMLFDASCCWHDPLLMCQMSFETRVAICTR